jgi:hypothetical protein
MAIPSTAAVEPRASLHLPIGARARNLLLAMGIAALFAGLCAAYFALNAGADYPEPLMQTSD